MDLLLLFYCPQWACKNEMWFSSVIDLENVGDGGGMGK